MNCKKVTTCRVQWCRLEPGSGTGWMRGCDSHPPPSPSPSAVVLLQDCWKGWRVYKNGCQPNYASESVTHIVLIFKQTGFSCLWDRYPSLLYKSVCYCYSQHHICVSGLFNCKRTTWGSVSRVRPTGCDFFKLSPHQVCVHNRRLICHNKMRVTFFCFVFVHLKRIGSKPNIFVDTLYLLASLLYSLLTYESVLL